MPHHRHGSPRPVTDPRWRAEAWPPIVAHHGPWTHARADQGLTGTEGGGRVPRIPFPNPGGGSVYPPPWSFGGGNEMVFFAARGAANFLGPIKPWADRGQAPLLSSTARNTFFEHERWGGGGSPSPLSTEQGGSDQLPAHNQERGYLRPLFCLSSFSERRVDTIDR